jgi:diacylglycerol kinase
MKRFRFAFRGIAIALRDKHVALHCVFALAAIAAAAVLRVSAAEWCAVIACIALVLALEMFNCAIERLCDKLHPGQDEKIGAVKDLCAGAVLAASIGAAIIGCIIFIPKIWEILK